MSILSMEPDEARSLTASSPLLYLHCEASRLVRIVYQTDKVTKRIWSAVSIRFLGEYIEMMKCDGEQLMAVIERLRQYARAMGEQTEISVGQGQVRSTHEAAH